MTGGEDWLEWSWYIDWSEHRWEGTREKLEKAKQAAAMKPEERIDPCDDIAVLADRDAQLSPGGARLGHKRKGPYMAYSFTWQGLDFLIADRAKAQKTNPSMVVKASGLPCLELGAHRCYELAMELVMWLGGHVVKEKLSRVDLCLDMAGYDIGPFLAAFKEERYITRAKSHGFDRSNGVTIRFGSKGLMLRIYDKLAELTKRQDGYKHSLMAFHRWSGVEPEAATRVEFELTRKTLSEHGIDTVADYFERRGDVIRYLCEDWMRFTEIVPDRTHTTRAATLPLWDSVTQGFLNWTGQPRGIALDPLPREGVDIQALLKGAAGTMLTSAVKRGRTFNSIHELMRFTMSTLESVFVEMGWEERMRQKAVKFADEQSRSPRDKDAAW